MTPCARTFLSSQTDRRDALNCLVIMNKKPSTANLSAYKRKRYAEIKNDPEMYEREKEKERLRYIMKKEKRQVIPIDEKSPRDQRQQRKKWREASKRYRENKKVKLDMGRVPQMGLEEC
ncbi:hypothetical protein PYW07_014649 [Mythimna separata]|uniref:Uncharacterized protein n=1 Tax=Mythimna separata TaxID=271217 RepID=A0AAD7Z105_MYTSE|nr:hypothetical protein PYW07_014649 [Mythimna separata]